MKDNNVTIHSLNFFECLALVFIALRLAGLITWPWVWVLAPLWLPVCLIILIACVVVLWGGKVKCCKKRPREGVCTRILH